MKKQRGGDSKRIDILLNSRTFEDSQLAINNNDLMEVIYIERERS